MTIDELKAAMRADLDAVRAKYQDAIDEVFGTRELAQYVVDIKPDMTELYEAINKAAREHGIDPSPHTVDVEAEFWAKVPAGYDWVAMDADGKCRSHEKEPLSFGGRWIHEAYTPYHHIPDLDDYHPRDDWRNSLRKRPNA